MNGAAPSSNHPLTGPLTAGEALRDAPGKGDEYLLSSPLE